MMTLLRGLVSGWGGKLMLGLMLAIFAVAWTVADGFSVAGSPNTVLTAGRTSVSLQDYQLAYQQNAQRVSQQIRRRPTPEEMEAFGVDQSTLSQLATGAVLDEQGRVLGLGLSEQGLLRLIAEDPNFQDSSGNFSRANFRALLQNAGLTEAAYLERLGDTALRSQIIDSVAEGVTVPQVFAAALRLYVGETRRVSTVTLTAEPADAIADPTAEELDTFFTAEAPDYAAPEYRAFAYVDLSAETVSDPSAITDEAIAAAYESEQARFGTPERRRVRQLVFPDQASADAAHARIEAGESFEAVATSMGRAPDDTDLGLLMQSEIPDANIGGAVFALDAGATSPVVAGIFGPTLVSVDAIEPAGVSPLADVSDEIREELALDAAAQEVNTAYNAFEDARAGGASVADAATEAGLTAIVVAAIDASGLDPEGQPVADLPAQGELLPALFETQPGFDNPPINYGSNAYVFYDVTEITPARARPLDEVRDEVVADWKTARAGERLDERLEALKARVEAGETLEAVAGAESLDVAPHGPVTRNDAAASLGQAAGNAAFSGPQGSIETAPGAEPGTAVLLRVDEAAAPAGSTASVTEEETQQISATLQNDVLEGYVTQLQAEYPVRFNQTAIQTARSLR